VTPHRIAHPATTTREAVRTLNPGSFALVMATGIISVDLRGHRPAVLSTALLWLAAVCYLALVGLHLWRLLAFRAEMRADLADPARGFGFFTFVAGTDVLGARLAADGHLGVAAGLLAVGGIGWLLLGYAVPWAALLTGGQPVVPAANGTWFIWVVATQSVAVLAATLEPATNTGRRELALLAVVCWSVGAVLYAGVAVFVAAQLMRQPPRPADLTPPYWVAMGATAITTVAGGRIVEMADAPMVAVTRGLVAGASVVFWAFGTWLIPPLLAAGWWRHITHRIPLRYEAAWWSIIFPLGMYAAAGHDLGNADHLPIVTAIGRYDTWPAVLAWALAFTAMLSRLARQYTTSHARQDLDEVE
jgi:tellurite resistance protein TehA-like permease